MEDKITIVFVDTNTLMHYQSIQDIDWLTLLNVTEARIAICAPVIDELDKHKSDSHTKRQDRARRVLARIREFRKNPVLRPDVTAFVNVDRVPKTFYDNRALDEDRADDRIIASALYFQERNANFVVIFCSDDFNPQVRAEECGLKVLILPEHYRTKSGPDPAEKQIMELRAKVLELEKGGKYLPELRLEFEDGSQVCTVVFKPTSLTSDNDLYQRYLVEERLTPPYDNEPESALLSTMPVLGFPSFNIPDLAKTQYARDREEYLRKYKEYLKTYDEVLVSRSRSISLPIFIRNKGKAPAKGSHISMHFPDGFELSDRAPSFPSKPERPEISSRYSLVFREPLANLANLVRPTSSSPPNISSPKIRRSNSFIVEQKVQNILHTKRHLLNRFYLQYEKGVDAKSFSIDYELIAENLPEAAIGKLHIKVETGQQ